MCQALPARVVRIDGVRAWVEGSDASVSLLGVEDIAAGDYILHCAGLVLGRVEPEEAAASAEAFHELDALYEEEDRRAVQESLGLTTRAWPRAGCSSSRPGLTDALVMSVALVPILAVDVLLEGRARSTSCASSWNPRQNVLRDGVWTTVRVEQLVPGDVVCVQEGDVLAADCRLLTGSDVIAE